MRKREASLPIEIRIAASEHIRPLIHSPNVFERCSEYLNRLVRALELPLQPHISLNATVTVPEGASARLWIHGHCVTLWRWSGLDEDQLVAALTERLLECRALLVNSAAAQLMWS